jgi:hypothetical protein
MQPVNLADKAMKWKIAETVTKWKEQDELQIPDYPPEGSSAHKHT